MDRFIYVAMTGASEALKLQATNSHNLANVSTTKSWMQSSALGGVCSNLRPMLPAGLSGLAGVWAETARAGAPAAE